MEKNQIRQTPSREQREGKNERKYGIKMQIQGNKTRLSGYKTKTLLYYCTQFQSFKCRYLLVYLFVVHSTALSVPQSNVQ
jgi:hypothetical protein